MFDVNGSSGEQDPIELFRELARQFPTVKAEDYFTGGKWQVDRMICDTELIIAHRREWGSPDPPPIEEVQLPELPGGARSRSTGYGQAPIGSSQRPTPAAPKMPTPAKAAFHRVSVAPSTGPPTSSSVSGPQSELRMIAAFVSKWGLDPTRTKLLLARLSPARRKAVIENFKLTGNGSAPTAALEKYIAQSEATLSSTNGFARLPAPKFVATPVKRPLPGVASSLPPAKRPAYVAHSAYPRAAVGATPTYVRPTPSKAPTSGPLERSRHQRSRHQRSLHHFPRSRET